VIVAVVAICIAAPIVWHKQIRFRLSPKNFGMVEEGQIYRGAWQHLNVLRDICEENEIRTIVALTEREPEVEAMCREMGITRYVFKQPGDGRGDPVKWAAVLHLLADESKYPIFVHCAAGSQRTTTAVMLFRKYAQDVPFQESFVESFDFRHKPDEWELLGYLADHGEEIFTMYDEGVIVRKGEQMPLVEYIEQSRTAGPEPKAE
jgi:hypothetical protein